MTSSPSSNGAPSQRSPICVPLSTSDTAPFSPLASSLTNSILPLSNCLTSIICSILSSWWHLAFLELGALRVRVVVAEIELVAEPRRVLDRGLEFGLRRFALGAVAVREHVGEVAADPHLGQSELLGALAYPAHEARGAASLKVGRRGELFERRLVGVGEL